MVEGFPLISVIVPTKNAARNIRDCLESIRRSTYPHYEVIVVDGKSSDGTGDIAHDLGARVIEGSARGRASDNNLGIAEAKGDIVAFTDDDCLVHRQWLERIADCFAYPRVGISGGPDLTYTEGANAVELAAGHIHHFYRSLASQGGADAVIGCNSAYRKSALLEAGCFDEGLPGAEDTPLHARILRLGYTVKPDPQCVVYHKRRATFPSLLKRYWDYGWHMGRAHRLAPQSFRERRRQIYPLLGGLLALLLLALASIRYHFLWWTLVFLFLGYLLFQLVLHRYLVAGTKFKSAFWVFFLASTLCMMVYAAGFAKEQVFPQKRP